VALALATAAVVALNLAQPLWVALALGPWLAVAGGLLLADVWLGGSARAALAPWMTARQARRAWAVLLGAVALRLAGAVHPFFDAHDLPVHDRWMRIVAGGQLFLYSTPGELQNRLTFNPPAGYLLLLPAFLPIGDMRLAIQAGTALVDALGCALLLPIARQLRLGPRAALLALALYAALPINLTMLWWGFATNDIAQTLWLALLWAILRLERDSTPRAVALVAVAAAACLATHAGALVLIVAFLGLLMLLGLPLLPRPAWLALVAGLALAALITLPLYFIPAAIPVLTQPAGPQARTLADSLARGLQMRDLRLDFVWRAYALGYLPPLLGAIPAGLLLLWRAPRRHPLQRALVAALLAISLVFCSVYVLLGFLARYIYFAAPFVCLAAGLLLARLWRRPWGRVLVLALVVLVAFSGAALWFAGVLLRDKPSLVPLTQ
jgi:toxin CptA